MTVNPNTTINPRNVVVTTLIATAVVLTVIALGIAAVAGVHSLGNHQQAAPQHIPAQGTTTTTSYYDLRSQEPIAHTEEWEQENQRLADTWKQQSQP